MHGSAERLPQDSGLLMDKPIQPPEGTWAPLQWYWTSRAPTVTRSNAAPLHPLQLKESCFASICILWTWEACSLSMLVQQWGASWKGIFFFSFSEAWFHRPPALASLGLPTTTLSFVLIYSLFPQVSFFPCLFHIQVAYCTSFPS